MAGAAEARENSPELITAPTHKLINYTNCTMHAGQFSHTGFILQFLFHTPVHSFWDFHCNYCVLYPWDIKSSTFRQGITTSLPVRLQVGNIWLEGRTNTTGSHRVYYYVLIILRLLTRQFSFPMDPCCEQEVNVPSTADNRQLHSRSTTSRPPISSPLCLKSITPAPFSYVYSFIKL